MIRGRRHKKAPVGFKARHSDRERKRYGGQIRSGAHSGHALPENLPILFVRDRVDDFEVLDVVVEVGAEG